MDNKTEFSNKKSNFLNEQQFIIDLAKRNHTLVFKSAISDASSKLHKKFKAGEQTSVLLAEKASFIDLILSHAWDKFEWGKKIALIAVGGYGRGELHPQSDIDLLILIDSNNPKLYKENIEYFLAFLWDIQLKNRTQRPLNFTMCHGLQKKIYLSQLI